MRILFFCQLTLIALLPHTVHAAPETALTATDTTEAQTSQVKQSSLESAARWGLDETEWARFKDLMQGPLGLQSPHLDPLSALGIEARDDAERTRYAELQVQMETARVTKLLAYQNAYDQAYKRLYPDILPVNLIGSAAQVSPVTANNRAAVFVTLDCKACDELIKRMQGTHQPFDIYLIDSHGNDDRIRTWARKSAIDPVKVRSQQITLNHDQGRWVRLDGQGDFPAVLRQHNGKWVRQ
ncbi:TIGR03759 family integrating conjugative element protein [Pseudomonas sp. 21LCFQ010]|uniref:TIGR03759 family integrating conjugative element protein n=1 Tax=Pseudomonas sp. 21LCFQ010 TaxID=2957506 RepID=UPI0020974397|nr:TIGR03759 family integrating conjugative element protein [Pseudomonas sp. 21LCFQ010]MCO8163871.1 TIGR03759 family integrating conjugative element protein [Pseudomonas sp. 21LCFQ010]